MSVAGIDIGTTSSVVAIVRRRGVDICSNEVSKRETASLVGFTHRMRLLGEAAASQQASNIKNSVGNFKRLLGRSFHDPEVQAELSENAVQAVAARDGSVAYKVYYNGEERTFTNTQITAMYLFRLREIASKEAGGRVVDCVFSVPLWFTDQQRRTLVDAAAIAGWTVLGLLSDTAAAAVDYGMLRLDLPEQEPEYVGFVDVGHSTTSCAIVAFTSKRMTVLGAACDRDLGGRHLDNVLYDHFAQQAKAKGLDVSQSPRASFRLRQACAKLKMVMTTNAEALTTIDTLMNDQDLPLRITRDAFVSMAQPVLARLAAPVQLALQRAGISAAQLKLVEVVGGSCRVPAVKEALREAFGRDLSFTLNASESIARGCALMGAVLSPLFTTRDFAVQDVHLYPIALSWSTEEGVVEDESTATPESADHVFRAGNAVPSVKQLTFPRVDRIEVSARYSDSAELPGGVQRDIGRFVLADVPHPSQPGVTARVKVKARLNWHGCVALDTAQVVEEEAQAPPADGAAAPAPKITRRNLPAPAVQVAGLKRDDVQHLTEEERAMQVRDREVVETAEARNNLESYIYDMRDKLQNRLRTFVPDADQQKLQAAMSSHLAWLDEADDDTPKSEFTSRLASMQAMTDEPERRFADIEARKAAEQELARALVALRVEAASKDAKHEHITEEERAQVVQHCAEAEQWLADVKRRQAETPDHAAPVVWSQDIRAKRTAVEAACHKLLNKPKPAPPKADAPKADAPKADAAQEERMDTSGTAPAGEAEPMDTS